MLPGSLEFGERCDQGVVSGGREIQYTAVRVHTATSTVLYTCRERAEAVISVIDRVRFFLSRLDLS